MMTKDEEITLTLESLSGDGKAVARQDGMVFFVEDAVPGDTVRARIWKLKKNYAEARAVEILTPSQFRVEPKCKHFGVCGGCRWQNLSYEAQLRFKHQRVVDAFTHIGGFQNIDIRPTIECESPYFYRNKMEYTFSDSRWLTEEEMLKQDEIKPEVVLGLHIPQRYDKVLNIEECWLQSEMSNAILNSVREISRIWNLSVYSTQTHEGYLRHLVIREGKRTNEVMVNIVTTTDWPEAMQNMTKLLLKQFPDITTIVNNITERKSMVAVGDSQRVYHGEGFIKEKIGKYVFHISPNSFFQTNTLQAEKLYTVAKGFAELKSNDIVCDLYSGTGTIAISMSDVVERVVGVEVIESSIEDAKRNAEINNIANCSFLKGNLAKGFHLKDIEQVDGDVHPTVIIADPPRNGMHQDVVKEIVALSPERIVYVSCNPSTQSRDAKMLADSGYQLKVVQPVDMFPHTDHIEAVALFTK